jgi:hypothetical protein
MNAALAAYVHSAPSRERLRAHLAETDAGDREAEVAAALDAVLDEVQAHAAERPELRSGGAAYVEALHTRLGAAFLWIEPATTRGLVAFVGWWAWREGAYGPS